MTRPKGRMYPFCEGSLMGAFLLRTTRASPEIPPHWRQLAGAPGRHRADACPGPGALFARFENCLPVR
jgi:hypothetical protein